MNITDKMIDGALAGLMISIICFAYYKGKALLSWASRLGLTKFYQSKYPISSPDFPLKRMKYGDIVEINHVGPCKFYGKKDEGYYIEVINPQNSFNGSSYMHADKNYLIQNAVSLSNSYCTKWIKQ